jgi:hypothetical protein
MPVGTQASLEAVVGATFHARRQTSLRSVITPELVREHRRAPLGRHADGLLRVLNYFGSLPIDGKLIVEYDGAESWFVCRLRGSAPLEAERIMGPFDAEASAIHAVFEQRLRDVFGADAVA